MASMRSDSMTRSCSSRDMFNLPEVGRSVTLVVVELKTVRGTFLV